MRILLDEQLPRELAPYLVGHDARTVHQESWAGFKNGALPSRRHDACPNSPVYDEFMQLAIGTVVGGKIVVDGDPLPEGFVVTILAREEDETFEVPPELEAELLESISQAERGETIPVKEVIARLRRIA